VNKFDQITLIIGVSGSGKTTIGKILASKINGNFFDADNFHSKDNLEKMKRGIELNDLDRKPWLKKLSKKIVQWEKEIKPSVLACSALKESYRKILCGKNNKITWIYLEGSFSLILNRIKKRKNHFMASSLLKSQFEILEIPSYALKIKINLNPEKIINQILISLNNE